MGFGPQSTGTRSVRAICQLRRLEFYWCRLFHWPDRSCRCHDRLRCGRPQYVHPRARQLPRRRQVLTIVLSDRSVGGGERCIQDRASDDDVDRYGEWSYGLPRDHHTVSCHPGPPNASCRLDRCIPVHRYIQHQRGKHERCRWHDGVNDSSIAIVLR